MSARGMFLRRSFTPPALGASVVGVGVSVGVGVFGLGVGVLECGVEVDSLVAGFDVRVGVGLVIGAGTGAGTGVVFSVGWVFDVDVEDAAVVAEGVAKGAEGAALSRRAALGGDFGLCFAVINRAPRTNPSPVPASPAPTPASTLPADLVGALTRGVGVVS